MFCPGPRGDCPAERQLPGPAGTAAPTAAPGIQDNSFLVEEAYNQNFGVVQHISSFTRFFDSKDWNYTFTQEWPVPGDERHQLSYTLVAVHSGAFPGSGARHRRCFPELSLPVGGKWRDPGRLFPARQPDISQPAIPPWAVARAVSGVQTSLPLSVVLSKKLVSHWNAGATFFPHAQDASGDRAATAGYNFGQSFIWLTNPRFNVMLETVFARSQTVVASNRTEWTSSTLPQPRNPLGLQLQEWFADCSGNRRPAWSWAERG